jgi:serine/threonine-protein kinase
LLVAGAVVGSYRVAYKLGEGGMGTVYLGEHTLLGRPAAIKVLQPSLSSNDEVVQRFFNEARAVTRIADPGIVQVFDFGHQPEVGAFIVMEWLDGESLDSRLRRSGPIGLLETLRLMRLLCGSLGAAHAKGIVHRDLKPENIFIVKDPAVPGGERPKILDFGIAKLAGEEPGVVKTRTGAVMGTPMYMSPEQCSGSAVVDHRSDIYAIGCVMFAMLTGRPPFHGPGPGDLIAAHLREPPPLAASRIPGLPGAIDRMLQCCLAKSAAERFPSMAELVDELAAVEHALYASSGAIPIAPPLDRFARPPSHSSPSQPPQPSQPLYPSHPSSPTRPTTLRSASGQASGQMPAVTAAPPGRRSIVGLIAGVVVLVGAGVAIARWSGDEPGPQGAAAPGPVTQATGSGASPPPPPPQSQSIDAAAAPASAVGDARVDDAPSAPPPPGGDAAVAQPHKPGAGGHHTTGGDHGPAGSAARPRIGRED